MEDGGLERMRNYPLFDSRLHARIQLLSGCKRIALAATYLEAGLLLMDG